MKTRPCAYQLFQGCACKVCETHRSKVKWLTAAATQTCQAVSFNYVTHTRNVTLNTVLSKMLDDCNVIDNCTTFCEYWAKVIERWFNSTIGNAYSAVILCVYMHICMCYMSYPSTTFFIGYINPITTFIVYIITFYSMFHAFDAIMFYCILSEMTRIKMVNQSIVLQ